MARVSVDHWPIEFQSPHKPNIGMKESFLKETASFFESVYSTTVDYNKPRISKYGRYKVNGVTFSSVPNTTDSGGIVKFLWMSTIIPYFGLVHFYLL